MEGSYININKEVEFYRKLARETEKSGYRPKIQTHKYKIKRPRKHKEKKSLLSLLQLNL
ncbi:MAG: hypothetical protein KJ592_03950 [Nanoarchaeota archaeon]|nr:hypothetical protein [Nanoarchaeota archaeon]